MQSSQRVGRRLGVLQSALAGVSADAPEFATHADAMAWLKGKPFAVHRGTCANRFVLAAIAKGGFAPSKVTFPKATASLQPMSAFLLRVYGSWWARKMIGPLAGPKQDLMRTQLKAHSLLGGGKKQGGKKGQDTRLNMKVSLDQVYNDITVKNTHTSVPSRLEWL